MWESDDYSTAFDCARRYFSGESTAEPVREIMSDKTATAVKDLTFCLDE
ncbi:MAG: hypothetical protein IJA92_06395 [Oscillospiraceae bacterium]|nr:hypothetical protein [Oscillospiraceae bacterium]